MGRKKHLQGIDEDDMNLINEKMENKHLYASDNLLNSYEYLDYKVSIKCKNPKQKEFLNLLKNDDKIICIGHGSAGTGKSMISLAYALNQMKNPTISKYKHIICIIPTCPAGNMNIGFLKGTLDEKIEPYLQADTHTMHKILELSGYYPLEASKTIDSLIRNEIIKYELVNFIRGKTYDDSLILINEAENYSKEEMLLILTRVGENSKIIITGDVVQCDRQDIKKSKYGSGLTYALQKLKGLDEFGEIEFLPEDIVRNPIITKIINLWE